MEITAKELNDIKAKEILMLARDSDKDESIDKIDLFYSKYGRFEKGVLNAVLIHSIRLKKGYIPNMSYLDKTIKTWILNDRKTTKKALNYLNQYDAWQASENPEKTKRLTEDKSEHWLNEYIDDIAAMKPAS